MSKANELRNATATIKEYCDNMKCRKGEKCLFHRDRNYLGGCMLAHAPVYWQEKTLKTRKEVFLEQFPNARLSDDTAPKTCVKNVFGENEKDYPCDHCHGKCRDCWDEPAPDEYQEDL